MLPQIRQIKINGPNPKKITQLSNLKVSSSRYGNGKTLPLDYKQGT
jgi:hypothetical protein